MAAQLDNLLRLESFCIDRSVELRVYPFGSTFPSGAPAISALELPDGTCALQANWAVTDLLIYYFSGFPTGTSAGALVLSDLRLTSYTVPNRMRPTRLVARADGNTYGGLTVEGATFDGAAIFDAQRDVTIQLGANPGAAGHAAQFDYLWFDVESGGSVTFRAGASGQVVRLVNKERLDPSSIAGAFKVEGIAGVAPPFLEFVNSSGITVHESGQFPRAAARSFRLSGSTTGIAAASSSIADRSTVAMS